MNRRSRPRLMFVFAQVTHDLSVGLFFQPLAMTAALAALALLLVRVELPAVMRPIFEEPAAAQSTLGILAGALMTVISVVYSVLIMAMTLASTQFSPRILANFLRGGSCQGTLGIFLGTFVYCLLVLRAVKTEPPFVPQVALWGAALLSMACLLWLVYFVHHIAQSIQVNYLVDHIASDTERLIDEEMPVVLGRGEEPAPEPVEPEGRGGGFEIEAAASGYIQLVDTMQLEELARSRGVELYVHRAVGDFVGEGGLLATAFPNQEQGRGMDLADACCVAFDIGPVRTMQQDVGFGVRQVVDVALKAISPAVNDPSTAATCTAQLGRLLMRASRRAPRAQGSEGPVFYLRRATFISLLELAFTQIRQYSRGDMAVSLSLLRALGDIVRACACSSYREATLAQLRLVLATRSLPAEDMALLRERVRGLEEPMLSGVSSSEAV